jgi:tetratricopeptide (TPR) repeat protein
MVKPARRRCVPLLFFFLPVVIAASPAAAEWKRLDSPNFVVVGDVPAGDLRQIARRFEGFYAQSWALAHMLLVEDPQRRAQLGTYMAALQDGLPPSEAWARGFGTDRIDRHLQSYVSRRSFRYYQFRFESRVTQVNAEATPLAAGDADAFLADFLARQERYDEALARLDKVSAGREESAWASAVRASIEVAQKQYERADERLLAVPASADWLAAYVAGTTLVNSFAGRAASPDAAQARAGEAFFRAAGEGREEIPNAVAKAAMLSLMRGDDPGPEGRAGVERARQAAPGRHDYAFVHAQILMRQSELAAARSVLQSLDADGQPQGVRDSARQMLGTLDRLEARRAGAPPAGAAPAAASPGPSPGVDRPETPIFRDVGPGEERVEGVLTAIECRQGAIVFHVDGHSPATRLSAPSFDEVDFITYRSDLTGTVPCGPAKEPMQVYVTVRPAAGGEWLVIAVEFLPRADRQ